MSATPASEPDQSVALDRPAAGRVPDADRIAGPGRLRFVPPQDWTVWRRPPRVLAYILALDVATIALTVAALVAIPLRPADLTFGATIVAAAMIYIEASRPIERIRERAGGTPHIDLNSTWTFAAALLLHPALVALLVTVVYLHRWIRVRHHVVHRQAFSAAATILSSYAAIAVLTLTRQDLPHSPRDLDTFTTIALAGLAYVAVNTILICGVIAMTQPHPTLRSITAGWDDYTLELATVALAILVAWSLTDWPAALALVFGVALVLHGKVLLPQWRHAARTDTKTGLATQSAWTHQAQEELTRATRSGHPLSVLMIDIDHFKRINDRHGHLFGDEVLLHVAVAITSVLRRSDLVGHNLASRFGGEEFTVLLPTTTPADAHTIADRIRQRIAALAIPVDDTVATVTVSIGVAGYPHHATTLPTLLQAADHACYTAKNSGRNAVTISQSGAFF